MLKWKWILILKLIDSPVNDPLGAWVQIPTVSPYMQQITQGLNVP